MELEGAKHAFSYLQSVGLAVVVFISDRHRGIASLVEPITLTSGTLLDQLERCCCSWTKKGCKKIADWVKGVRNHLYWCAKSTKDGFQEMITAKWKSFMEHVTNKHDNHPSPLFKKCAHDETDNRQWIRIGIVIRHVKKSINPLYRQFTVQNNLECN